MAKKSAEKKLVDCTKCFYGGMVINFLLDCTNKERNPNGYKVGSWLKECQHFKPR